MARPTPTGSRLRGRTQRGFTLLGLLFLLAGMGVAMAALGTMWHTASQRDKERDLLFVGDQYRQAI
jgi:type II secretory pathway pseudopilin PulG